MLLLQALQGTVSNSLFRCSQEMVSEMSFHTVQTLCPPQERWVACFRQGLWS